jgi:transposase
VWVNTEDLKVVEPKQAREIRADANVTRLTTILDIDMVVAVGLIAAIGLTSPFVGTDRLVAYLGLNLRVHRSGSRKPRRGHINEQCEL